MFNIIDKRTGKVVRKGLKSRMSAMKSRDRLDNQYGSYIHMIVRNEA